MSKKIQKNLSRLIGISSVVSSLPNANSSTNRPERPGRGDLSKSKHLSNSRKNPIQSHSDRLYVNKRITREILVPASAVSNNGELNIIATCIDQDKRQISSRTFNISHQDQIRDLKSPTIAPTIQISKDFQGVNIIYLTQNDPFSDSIRLTYRSIDLDRDKYYKFTTIQDYNLTMGESIQIEHKTSDSNLPGCYRAIPMQMKNMSHIFSEAKSKPVKCEEDSLVCIHYSCSIDTRPVKSGVEITISNITGSPAYGYICRKNLTNFEKDHTPIFYVSSPRNGGNIQHVDKDVEDGYTYEYVFKYYSTVGDSRISKNRSIIEFIIPEPSMSAIITKKPSAPGVAKFSLTGIIEKDPGQAVQDIVDQSSGEEQKNSSDLLIFKIERKSLLDGSVRDLGYHMSGDFLDRVSKNTFNPAGYRYKFELFFKERSGLIDEISESISSGARSSIPTYFQSSLLGDDEVIEADRKSRYSSKAKFFNRSAIKEGTLCYGAAARSNRSSSIVERGRTGVVEFIDVLGSASRPTVGDIKSRINNKKEVILTWGIKGSSSSIDHFIITASFGKSGTSVLVGVSHHIASGGTYTFTHKTLRGYMGAVRYTIVPVCIDFKRGTSSSKVVKVWGKK